MSRPTHLPFAESPEGQSGPLAALACRWLAEVERSGSRSTARSAHVLLVDLRRFFGAMELTLSPAGSIWESLRVAHLTRNAITVALAELSDVYSEGSRRRTKSSLMSFLRWVEGNAGEELPGGWHEAFRARGVRYSPEVAPAAAFDVAQVRSAVLHRSTMWPERDVVLLEACAVWALTVDEMCALSEDAVDENAGILFPGPRQPRRVQLDVPMRHWAAYRRSRAVRFPSLGSGTPYLLRDDGRPFSPSAVRAGLTRVCRLAGVDPRSARDLRGLAITRWLTDGMDVGGAASRAGLSSWSAIQRYAPTIPS